MDRLLIVEDSPFFLKVVENGFIGESDLDIIKATTLKEAEHALNTYDGEITIALVDLSLPDSLDGEAAEATLAKGIPTVIFTSNFNEEIRDNFLAKGVLDFVLKDNPTSLGYLLGLVRRVIKNKQTEVLVVDDSSVALIMCAELLRRYMLIVHTAKSGDEAYKIIENNPRIRLLITDNEMPGMDGFELVTKARLLRSRSEMAIIGFSASGGAPLSAKFLKHGANDFIAKPYLPEELYTRVALNLDTLDNLEQMTLAATRDFLTGLHNRRAFFDLGNRVASTIRRDRKNLAVAMMDIDHFKKVNDTYGHDVGDVVLQKVAKLLNDHINRGNDFCARLGGEEFAIILEAKDRDKTIHFVEKLRQKVQKASIELSDTSLSVTASFGLSFSDAPEIDVMLNEADQALYSAKESGRNQVCIA